ncbi:MAG: hypothetical protein JF571_08890, partial [Asticcacaulis sp.]|nr:hypothetical protein [Asticcacaulis sp.]
LRFDAVGDTDGFTLLHPRDMLLLSVRLQNLKVTGVGENRRIVIIDSGKTAFMTVEHQPQAIAEQTWPEDGGVVNNSDRAETYIAGPTRLVYSAPKGFSFFPFTADEVLKACMSWRLNLSPRAVDAVGPGLDALETIRQRLDAVAEAQKADLHKFDPRVEPVLRRAGLAVAEAMLDAAQQQKNLSSTRIDSLIRHEILASLHPGDLNKGARAKTPAQSQSVPATKAKPQSVQKLGLDASDPHMGAYVERVALQEVIRSVSPLAAPANPRVAGTSRAVKPADPAFTSVKPVEPTVQIIPGLQFAKTSGTIEDDATDIEAPFRVHLTPLSTAGFAHSTGVVDHNGRIAELWHSRMGGRAGDWTIGDTAQPVRVLYSEDEDFPPVPGDNWALLAKHRRDLVQLTRVRSGYNGLPAVANHLRLTALGASMDVLGNWTDLPDDVNLSQWKHVSSIGRDQFVRVIEEGYLFPFGHAAAQITVSERKFRRQANGGRVAVLLQKKFIVVRDRVRTYPGDGQLHDGRDCPFASVEILTRQTPNLDITPTGPSAGVASGDAYWPTVGGAPFAFHIAAVDTAGNRTTIDMPLVFLFRTTNADNTKVAAIVDAYKLADDALRAVTVNTAMIRFSRDIDAAGNAMGGESDYPASRLRFGASLWATDKHLAHFYPAITDADIDVPSLKQLLGKPVAPKVTYHEQYLARGFDAFNPAQVVFKFAPVGLGGVTTDKFGGLAAPDLNFDGLSRKAGVLNGVENYLKPGGFSPADVFKGAKLLGIVAISDIISLAGISDPGVPKLTTVDQGDRILTKYVVEKDDIGSVGPFIALPPTSKPQFSIVSTVTISKSGGTPDTRVDARIGDFKINLFGFIILHFSSLSLTVKPGSKTDVNPVLDPDDGVRFGGPLEFVNALRNYIPMDGFSDPPALDVTTNGITASYTLGLPSISVGALSLQNISLGAGFDLPFNGDGPSARFNFAERHNPFNLTVSLFGGGGFFALGVDTSGVRELEATLEFGAQVSIDLGVASGGVYIKGGFYFHWKEDPGKLIQFEGYVEMGGHLSVLGLISVSLVFHLGLTYEKTDAQSRLYGTATLTVEIDILFFSCSQDITVERQFAGSDADPAFVEYVRPADGDKSKSHTWDEYCAAFA